MPQPATRAPDRRFLRPLLTASVVSVPFILTHVFEDFAHNVHEVRFGVPLLPAGFDTLEWALPHFDTAGEFLSLAWSPQCSACSPAEQEESLSLHPMEIGPVPEETARVARASFPRGNASLRLRDALGGLYDDAAFTRVP